MKVTVLNINGKKTDTEITLPEIFSTPLRPDVIKRAVLAEQSFRRQKQGVNPLAGKLVSVENWGPGRGAARVPRTKGSRTPSAQRGAFVPQARGGHKAHPPKTEKKIVEKINRKEHKLALYSSIAYTAYKEQVTKRGHKFKDNLTFPIVVETKAEEISKTRDAVQLLSNLGVISDIERVKQGRKIRPGKGKMRGRRYKTPVGPLIVVSNKDCNLYKSARNIIGVTIAEVTKLNTELMAPGTDPGRLTIWTEEAIKILSKNNR